MKDLGRKFYVVVFLGLGLAALAGQSLWRERELTQEHKALAKQSAALVVQAISAHLQQQQHLLRLFTKEHAQALDDVITRPTSHQAEARLAEAVAAYFPSAFAHTLSNATGQLVLEDFEGLVGDNCRRNIQVFAQTGHQHLLLHPNPLKVHYDVMTPYRSHIFFVSFTPDRLIKLLAEHQPTGIKLMVVQQHSSLIEICSEGDRLHLSRARNLSTEERAALLATLNVPNTEWRIVALPDPKQMAALKHSIRQQSLFMALVLLVLAAAIYFQFRREHQSRLDAESKVTEMAALGFVDALTELPNRRALDTDLAREWLNMERSNEPLSVLMVDLDHFKTFNDTYGHLAGDHCLRLVAQAMRNTLKRPRDRIARFGGEEFAVLLPNTTCLAAKLLADALHEAVYETFREEEGTQITISIGLACAHAGQFPNAEALIELADQALYAAKSAGRNTTMVMPVA